MFLSFYYSCLAALVMGIMMPTAQDIIFSKLFELNTPLNGVAQEFTFDMEAHRAK